MAVKDLEKAEMPSEHQVTEDKAEGVIETHRRGSFDPAVDGAFINTPTNKLHRDLKGRHMQMIAIGGAIGAGLFVGSGSALHNGGPASLVLCFAIIGIMVLCTVYAIAELAVLYPVNGAYYTYIVRFVDPSLGFAMGWDYAIGWVTAAGITIQFWRDDLNIGIWIALFLVVLSVIQIFGVRGYGEVEFILSTIKILACAGFIILGIIIDCGGVPTDNRGYIGAKYWYSPGAFRNGFQGFLSVFVTASFAYGGTELVGLAAAESADPKKEIPRATKQTFWRIALFYVINLLIVGLIVPSDSDVLLGSSGANTKASPFVYAIQSAGIKALPSIFNAVITISVISVANSATFASTRTLQALAMNGMAPKFLAYVDKKGRPLPTIILQLVFGLLAFANESTSGGGVLFTWLLALSGLSNFFIYMSVCLAHIRFRAAWKANGHSIDELPYRAPFGLWGSWFSVIMNFLCLVANFYIALYSPGQEGPPDVEVFFENYLAVPVVILLYLIWKTYSWIYYPEHRPFYVKIKDIDIYAGMREGQMERISGHNLTAEERNASIAELKAERKRTPKERAISFLKALV